MEPQLSLRGLLSYAASFFSQVPLSPPTTPNNVTPYEPLSGGPSCPIDSPVSCQKTPPEGVDSCCYIAPSGRMLLAQFWDEQVHAGGTEEDWTLHGLWPDLCDGTYKAYCGMTPHFENITEILEHHGQGELVQHMNRYWVAAYGSNAHLWAHEYNKHASCINTLRSSCYADAYAPGVEVVDYFTRAFHLFRSLDSYRALERAGITPTRARRYPLKDVQAAMEQFSGGKVVLRCGGRGRATLHEAWYVFFVQRSLQAGEFIPARDYGAHGDVGNCADEIWYLPKVCRLPGGCNGEGELELDL